jgi:hypothetical protein
MHESEHLNDHQELMQLFDFALLVIEWVITLRLVVLLFLFKFFEGIPNKRRQFFLFLIDFAQ